MQQAFATDEADLPSAGATFVAEVNGRAISEARWEEAGRTSEG
jgi:hypothetical protein